MHCASCEVVIEGDIKAIKGVRNANASLKNNDVEIITQHEKHFPSVEDLNKKFKDLGYSFSTEKPANRSLKKHDLLKVGGVVAVFILLFTLLEKSMLFASFTVTDSSSLPVFFVFGFMAGLSSCAALVGGILLSLSKQWNETYRNDKAHSSKPFILFNVGRLISFAVLGGLLGLIGSALQFSVETTAIVTIIVSFMMIILGFQMLGIKFMDKFTIRAPKRFTGNLTAETNFKGKYMPFVVGALTFFIPCGFTLVAQSAALSAGNFVNSGLMLLAFALGTLPVLAAISFTSVKLYSNPKFSLKFNYFAGLLVTFFALYTLNSQLNVLGLTSLNNLVNLGKNGLSKNTIVKNVRTTDEVQYLQMEASKFDYYPKNVSLKVGVPVVWEFYNRGVYGCAQAAYARGLYPEVIYLQPGMNIIKFTPKQKGTFKLSCTMGMVDPVTIKVY